MTIKAISFYNTAHNGDIFASKEYIRQIIESYPEFSFSYFHQNSPKLLADLPVSYMDYGINPLPPFSKFIVKDDTIFINTWIGNYLYLFSGINWYTYYLMFKEIYQYLEDQGLPRIRMKKITEYIPQTDFSFFDVDKIVVPNNSILMSNGPSMSGQSDTQGFESTIERILSETNYNIILTHNSEVLSDRIFYTNDIISTKNGDLNEISYISERCDISIGRNSGPFCYMHTQSILMDSSKVLISVGNREEDCFPYHMKLKCSYNFINDTVCDVPTSIMEIIGI